MSNGCTGSLCRADVLFSMKNFSSADAIECASINGRENIYFLGSFADRISFASQQRRAIRLINAMVEEKKLHPTMKVAVVGAGIAGLTAACAAISVGCSVDIYEKGDDYCHLQAGTSRRWIHPTANFWPQEPIRHVTEFPFLNWHSATCKKVIEQIVYGWKTYGQGNCRTFLNTTVTKLENRAETVELYCINKFGVQPSVIYDRVILCVGFGFEQSTSFSGTQSRSYWIDSGWDTRDFQRGRSVWISGSGDGAFFDALDILYSKFNEGRLVSELAIQIDHLRKEFIRIENICDSMSKEEGDKYAHNEYLKLAEHNDVANFLNSRLAPEGRRVTILHRSKYLLNRRPAPLHRLMIAHALKANRIDAVWGELDINSAEASYLPLPSGPRKRIENAIAVVVRHGATTPLRDLLGDATLKRLLASPTHCKQEALLDMQWAHGGHEFFASRARYRRIFPCRRGAADAWNSEIVYLVSGVLQSYNIHHGAIGCKRIRSTGEWVIEIDVPGNGPHTTLGDTFSEFFGMAIQWKLGRVSPVGFRAAEFRSAA